jgi:WD40-like Beta Propeller Repeat
VRAAAIVAILAAGTGILAGTVLGASNAGERIAFTNNKAIYVIGTTRAGLRRVTHSAASDGGIAWSNDGKLLAFTRYFGSKGCGEDQIRGDLYLIGADGKGERRLTSTGCTFDPPRNPAFAPKGNVLAFEDDKGILLATAPDWKPRVVLDRGLFPSWAPDARRIVELNGPTIEVLDTATHQAYLLARGDDAAWAHGLNSVAYASSAGIFVVHPPRDPVQRVVAANRPNGVQWSPDDTRIAYYTSSGHPLHTTSWVVPASGGKPVKLGGGDLPAWSPKGDWITVDGDDGWIYLVRPNGNGRHPLTKGFGAAWAPVP